jgi:hypothetical protein
VTTIKRLMQNLPIIGEATELPTAEDWAVVEESLKLELPADYKLFLSSYGSGIIDDFLFAMSPCSSNKYMRFDWQVPSKSETSRAIRQRLPKEVPFPVYPEPGGLLVWAVTDNGDTLNWLTKGKSNVWPTIVLQARGPKRSRFDMPATKILDALVTGKVRSDLFPSDFPSAKPAFRPGAHR